MRQLGVSYRTPWLHQQKIGCVIAEADEQQVPKAEAPGDAYLGDGRPGVGRCGSPMKVPFVAAASLSATGCPL